MDFTNISKFVKTNFEFKSFVFEGLHDMPEGIDVYLKRTRKTAACPLCTRTRCKIEFLYTRKIRDIDFRKKCTLIFPQAKINCMCGYRGIERLEFVDKHSLHTKRFEEAVAKLCEKTTIKDAAEICKIDWKTAKNIDKKALSKLKVSLAEVCPEGIGIDEVAYQKGHNYLTITRELEANRVIWIGIGRKKEILDQFFIELGIEKAAKIRVASMDMWDPFIASVKEYCPCADIVFDKFHVSKKVNEALDAIRKSEFSNADPIVKKDMKHKRFLMLGRRKNLSKQEEESLENLMKNNTKLYKAYLLKEQILDVFNELNPLVAMRRLIIWFANVREAKIMEYIPVLNTIINYLPGIINYFKYHITNAASEAINNKINVIKRMAYGFHDIEYFKLKILQRCGRRSS